MSENVSLHTGKGSESLQLPNRRIVSYFDHEFTPLSLMQIEHDMTEIVDMNFTNVVLCVTEKDIVSKSRMDFIKDAVEVIRRKGLEIWADPWSVGDTFGGEGGSLFKESKELACMCNPHHETLMNTWIDKVALSGITTIFWDEPEMKHDAHRNNEVRFLEKYTAAAAQREIESVVCLCANPAKKHQLREVAALPDVIEIGTDPYVPSAFERMTAAERQTYFTRVSQGERLAYVAEWVDETLKVAQEAGKRSHIWVQNFGLPSGYEYIVEEHIAVCRSKMADIAIWGYRGCESVPDFVQKGAAEPLALWKRTKTALTV